MQDPASRAVIHRPPGVGIFQFVVLSKLRAAQLMRGCLARVDRGMHKHTVIAQLEVAAGKVVQMARLPAPTPEEQAVIDAAIASSTLVPMSAD